MRFTIQPRLIVGLVALLLAPAHAAKDRWWSSEQADSGETVYRQNCMSCHLVNGAAGMLT